MRSTDKSSERKEKDAKPWFRLFFSNDEYTYQTWHCENMSIKWNCVLVGVTAFPDLLYGEKPLYQVFIWMTKPLFVLAMKLQTTLYILILRKLLTKRNKTSAEIKIHKEISLRWERIFTQYFVFLLLKWSSRNNSNFSITTCFMFGSLPKTKVFFAITLGE